MSIKPKRPDFCLTKTSRLFMLTNDAGISCNLRNTDYGIKAINNKKVLATMQKKTRSLLEELDAMYVERDRRHVIENRASNIIASAIRLLEEIDATYAPDQAENLHRKLLNAIKLRDPDKFTRTVRRTDANL